MTISRHTFYATKGGTAGALKVIDASFTLDAGYEPYARATVRIAKPTASLLYRLDPLTSGGSRIFGEIRQDFGDAGTLASRTSRHMGRPLSARTTAFPGQPLRTRTAAFYIAWNPVGVIPARVRPFDLAIRELTIDHRTAEVTLELASDEALLQDDALMASQDYGFFTTSVREIATIVLSRIGAALQPGTANGNVDQDSAVWQPGISASDFLQPLTEKAGLKLRCDEQRRWYLDKVAATRPGQLNLSAEAGITELTERSSRDSDTWYDGVVIEYTWRDENTGDHRVYDYAPAGGSANRVKRIERRDTRYPGPGAAAIHLRALQGQRLELSPRAVSDPGVEPGQAVIVSFPPNPPDGAIIVAPTPPQTGYVRAVTWDYPADEMQVTTRGLTDTPDTAWIFDPPGTAWNQIPAGIDWMEDI